MKIFSALSNWLQQGQNAVLLLVLQSQGSSPGRQGFKMAINDSGEMVGSIGGGIMEHKLIELSKNLLQKGEKEIIFKHQIHSKKVTQNQSGMICSGEQSIAIVPISENRKNTIFEIEEALQSGNEGILTIASNQFSFQKENTDLTFDYEYSNPQKWIYQEKIGFKKYAHIIGGGHVGRAVSQVLKMLNFHVSVIDNRENLNTLESNPFAHQKIVHPYDKIKEIIPEGKNHFIFIMTFGYRPDLEVLQQLIDKKVAFIGMMGSQTKVDKLLDEMRKSGYSEDQIKNVHSPIGMPIKSRTPEEIAISVAAQIIQIQNKDLP